MAIITDQTGHLLNLSQLPRRIISLVPSQTELLYDLGLDEEVVGITKFCVHPEKWFHSKTRIGGTKKLDFTKIRSLQPDLIIANKEENEKEQVEALMEEFPVWVSDIHTLADALAMIRSVGEITGREKNADGLIQRINREFRELQDDLRIIRSGSRTSLQPPLTAYFIWCNPWMVAGGDTFISEMMQLSGFKNGFEALSRYPEVMIRPSFPTGNPSLPATGGEELSKHDLNGSFAPSRRLLSDCQLFLLSSEPYPFKEIHKAELQALFPSARILFADGEIFSWYGSRLVHAPGYLKQLLRLYYSSR